MKQSNITKNPQFTVYIEQDEDGVFIGSIPALPSCYAQGETQKEMLDNLQEVISLCLRNIEGGNSVGNTKFIGIQNIELTHA